MKAHERFKDYKGNKCWQAHVADVNLKEDLEKLASAGDGNFCGLRTSDFIFEYVDKADKAGCAEIKAFIERHEWLGSLPNRPTHRFIARWNGHLAGAVIMGTPNTFSHLLGPEMRHQEKLISRGACISWAPKNLASWMLSRSMKWMVKNTEFRIFTAYSDPEAKELGTIYQALNFFYLGQSSGTNKLYFDPARPDLGWFCSRNFRHISKYHRYAREIGMPNLWKDNPNYMGKYSPNWKIVPPEIKSSLKAQERAYQASCIERTASNKHKYAYILGEIPSETKRLRKLFAELNPEMVGFEYPKQRGV